MWKGSVVVAFWTGESLIFESVEFKCVRRVCVCTLYCGILCLCVTSCSFRHHSSTHTNHVHIPVGDNLLLRKKPIAAILTVRLHPTRQKSQASLPIAHTFKLDGNHSAVCSSPLSSASCSPASTTSSGNWQTPVYSHFSHHIVSSFLLIEFHSFWCKISASHLYLFFLLPAPLPTSLLLICWGEKSRNPKRKWLCSPTCPLSKAPKFDGSKNLKHSFCKP